MTPPAGERMAAGLRVVGLFAGVGGIELGLRRAGLKTDLLCELDDAARAVLKARFPETEVRRDVRRVRLPDKIDVLTAGFPCTDLSQAGQTAGINGSASGLIASVLDGIERKRSHRRPDWLVLENVPFLLQLHGGAGIQFLTERVSKLGYRWAYRVVDTRAFGLPQRRRRVLFVAGRHGDPRSVLFADEAGDLDVGSSDKPPVGFYWTEGNTGIGWAPGTIPTLKGGSGLSIPSPPAIWLDERIATPHIRDAERLQGLPVNWTLPAAEVTGTDRARWKLVGNAVSVPVAEWIGRRLLDPGDLVVPEVSDWPGGRWPTAAWGEARDGRLVVKVVSASEYPLNKALSDLANFLVEDPADLSSRATMGFLSRLMKSRLRQRKLKEFVVTLREHAVAQGGNAKAIPAAARSL